jgi:3-hydroxyacyl-[acyl-carrier-protein] dehydratase
MASERAAQSEIAFDGPSVRRCLPHAHPFTLLDRVTRYVPEQRLLLGLKLVSQNEPFLQGHFPDYPILPGVIIIEALSQTSGMLMNLDILTQSGVVATELTRALEHTHVPESFLAESRFKHTAGVYPGDQMVMESQVVQKREELYVFRVTASVAGVEVGKGQLTIARSLGSSA